MSRLIPSWNEIWTSQIIFKHSFSLSELLKGQCTQNEKLCYHFLISFQTFFFIDFVSFVEHIKRSCFLLPQTFQKFHKSSAYDFCEVLWIQSFMWRTVPNLSHISLLSFCFVLFLHVVTMSFFCFTEESKSDRSERHEGEWQISHFWVHCLFKKNAIFAFLCHWSIC